MATSATFQAPAIANAYRPVLTTAEKVSGLSLFWSEARRNVVYSRLRARVSRRT